MGIPVNLDNLISLPIGALSVHLEIVEGATSIVTLLIPIASATALIHGWNDGNRVVASAQYAYIKFGLILELVHKYAAIATNN
ncbi:hypothetical protein [Chamaesiphon sp.]|uniref:hypothetical protein n=1 Tax=Chamaesiphon sp. TaxID=2814140 RepID=UPI0035930A35